MGQSINAEVKFTSEKRCVFFYINDSAYNAIIDGGNETTTFFYNLLKETLTERYPEETFMVYAESERDFENSYQDWGIVQNGNLIKAKSIVKPEDEYDYYDEDEDNTEDSVSIPDWYINHENGEYFHCISYVTSYATNSIHFYGEFTEKDNDLFLKIAMTIAEKTDAEYVVYDYNNVYCIHNRKIITIDSLPESTHVLLMLKKKE